MKQALKRWGEMSLVLRIVIGLVVGVALGLLAPAGITVITLLGTVFVNALKAVAPVLVFFLVISALANAHTAGTMKNVVILYIVGTFMAAVVAVLASYLFPITLSQLPEPSTDTAAPEGIGSVLTTLILNIVDNPVNALCEANYIGILTWAIMIGIAMRRASKTAKGVMAAVSDAITTVVHWVIQLAPFGVLGLAYSAVSENGMEIFTEYGMLILVLVGCMLFMALVVNPLIVFLVIRRNPYPLVFRCLKDSAITAFFTRSSAANIPVNLDLCRKLGLEEGNYSVSIPLGATINMAGASVTIAVLTMAACNTLGISVDPMSAILLCVLTAVSAAGASGVPGGSLLLIPLACSLFNIDPSISAQMIGVGMIIGVIQDSFETALNSSSDALFTATAEYALMKKQGMAFEPGRDADPHPPLARPSEPADGSADGSADAETGA